MILAPMIGSPEPPGLQRFSDHISCPVVAFRQIVFEPKGLGLVGLNSDGDTTIIPFAMKSMSEGKFMFLNSCPYGSAFAYDHNNCPVVML